MKTIPPLLLLLCHPCFAAPPALRAIVVDGDGPWRDSRWTSAVTEFNSLFADAGYSVTTVAPADLPAALPSRLSLLAVPSLETLPFEAFNAITANVSAGGSLIATGGQPFRSALYSAGGQWLDYDHYAQQAGSPPPQGTFRPPNIETISPAKKQYTNSAGLRVPIARARGFSATPSFDGRYRAIGDLLAPAATIDISGSYGFGDRAGAVVVWLPSPHLDAPQRAQLISALQASANRLYLISAGPEQMVWLPGEDVAGRANLINGGDLPLDAVLRWSIAGPSGTVTRPDIPLTVAKGDLAGAALDFGNLTTGDYTATIRLLLDGREIDRIDSPFRVFDPTAARRPDRKIRIVDGRFSAGGKPVFLSGVNYWPRYIAGIEPVDFNGRSWLAPEQYDPDLVEADLRQIAALHFNLVNIQYGDLQNDWDHQGRSMMDFLDRCRRHGIWVRAALRTSLFNEATTGTLNQGLAPYLTAASLPGDDTIFAYELFWEPFLGSHDQGGQGGFVNGVLMYNLGRLLIDGAWRTWVNEQYGSLAQAEGIWGFSAPRDAKGQLTNPLDEQMTTDGPWRVMVAAYRRFLEDYLGRNIGLFARVIRKLDPETPLTYRNWETMTATHNFSTGYDIGTGAAHLDFVSPERYGQRPWPADRGIGLVVAYSRYRSGNKPVQWTEFGFDIGANGGTADSRTKQATVCDTVMRQVADDGSNAASVWWWPGGAHPSDATDFGIIDPDGTPRDCARVLSQWNATFAATPPDGQREAPVRIPVDRDADARGSYGLYLSLQDRYVEARQNGQPVELVDDGAGTDTSSMPQVQVGNAPYSGRGPLKYANAEFGGIDVRCSGLDQVVENGARVKVPAGSSCEISPTLVNTGEAQWLPAASAKGGVVLHTSAGDLPLGGALPALQRTLFGPLRIPRVAEPIALTGRPSIEGVGEFGESLNLTLVPAPRER